MNPSSAYERNVARLFSTARLTLGKAASVADKIAWAQRTVLADYPSAKSKCEAHERALQHAFDLYQFVSRSSPGIAAHLHDELGRSIDQLLSPTEYLALRLRLQDGVELPATFAKNQELAGVYATPHAQDGQITFKRCANGRARLIHGIRIAAIDVVQVLFIDDQFQVAEQIAYAEEVASYVHRVLHDYAPLPISEAQLDALRDPGAVANRHANGNPPSSSSIAIPTGAY